MTETMPDPGTPIIVFDALCVLCAANAQFVLRHDKNKRFRLASMQGEVGAGLYRRFGLNPVDPDTLIVVVGDHVLRNLDAVVAIYAGCGWPWRLATVLRAVPRWLRYPLYRHVARNRYRWFGKRKTCWLPDAQDRDRVL